MQSRAGLGLAPLACCCLSLGAAERRALRALGDLACLEAPRAYVGSQGAAVLLDPDFLQVRGEAALGGDHRVASGVAERRSLAAAVAYLGHEDGGWYRLRRAAVLLRGRSQPIWRLSRAMRAMVSAALRP